MLDAIRDRLPDSRLFRFGLASWLVTSLMLAVTKLLSSEWIGRVDPVEVITLLYSEVFVSLAFLSGVMTLAWWGERDDRITPPAYVAIQSASALLVGVNLFDYAMFSQTKVVLEWSVVEYALANLGDLQFLIKRKIQREWLFYLMAFGGTYIGIEVIVFRNLERRAQSRDTRSSASSSPALSVILVSAVASFVCLAIAIHPPARQKGRAVGRESTLNLLYGALRPNPADLPEDVEPLEAPTDLSLEPTDATERLNVAFVVMESTRASVAAPYDASNERMPFVGQLAERSTVMTRAYALVPHTSKALVAMNCGVPPHPVMPVLEATSAGIPARCLPELLGDHGYDSVFLSTGSEQFENRRRLIDEMGYDRAILLEDMNPDSSYDWVNYFGFEDLAVLEPSRTWLEARDGEPFMATYLTITPHYDYELPSGFEFRSWVDDPLFNRYLNTIHYQDHVLEKLIEQYRELGLYEETLVVLVADHGEAFGEHGRWVHDNVPYDEVMHVTWLMHRGDRQTSRRIDVPVSHQDLVPTIADQLGYNLEGDELPGTAAFEASSDRILPFRCWYVQSCLAAVQGHWKYIYHYDNQPAELFDLAEDPGERHNVAAEHPERVERLREFTFRWHQRVREMYGRD